MNINCSINEKFLYRLFFTLIAWLKKTFAVVNLKNITKQEETIIKKYFNNCLNEYTLDYVTLKETDDIYPIILKLIKRNIINGYSDLEKINYYDGNGIKYKLTNKAWKKLNKKYARRKN